MSISKSFNKNNGITYVYDVYENYWDKEKKKYVQKRRLIGKINPDTGEIVPTRSRKRAVSQPEPACENSDSSYQILYEQTKKELEQKNLEISLLNTKLDQLQKKLSSVLKTVIPALQSQIDQLEKLEQE